MQLSITSTGSVQLKTRNETVSLGDAVLVNQYEIPGMGEYDVAGIQCEAYGLSTGIAYFIRLEDLLVAYLSEPNAEIEKLDDASGVNILVVDLRSDDTADKLKGIIKSLEPSYVVLRGAGATEAVRTGLGLPTEQITSFKASRTALPLEGTTILYS